MMRDTRGFFHCFSRTLPLHVYLTDTYHRDITLLLRILFLRPVSEDWDIIKGKDTNSNVGNFQVDAPSIDGCG